MKRDELSDVSPVSWEAAERLLIEWGDEYARIHEALGKSAATTIAKSLEHAQAFEDEAWRPRRRVRRECLDCGYRSPSRRWGAFVGPKRKRLSWSSDACPRCKSLHYREATLTARGRETKVAAPGRLALQALSTQTLRIEAALTRLPDDWMRDVLHRRYRIRQPDRKACQELRVTKSHYQRWINMAVAQFAIVWVEAEVERGLTRSASRAVIRPA